MTPRPNRLLPHIRSLLNFERPPGVVEWLEQNIVIPASMSPRQPGPFRVSARPQMAPILECFHPSSGVRDLDVAAGTQWAKTTIGCLGTCYLIKNAPGPMLITGPSEDWTREEIAKKRLRALIEENHILSIEKPYNSDDFRLLHMAMIGMPIDLVGANSPTALAGSTRRYIIVEECSKIQHTEHEDAPEAHPIKNAMERTKDFAGIDFHYTSSTPNSPNHIFWQRHQTGSQTTFPIRCPHCGEWFPFEWVHASNRDTLSSSFFEKTPSDYASIVWSESARGASGVWDEQKVRETARFVCPHNGCHIDDEQKIPLLQRFEEHHGNPAASRSHRSFRVPSFYSPRVTFGDMALKFLDKGDLFSTGLQTFCNSWLAMPWEQMDANVKETAVLKLRDLADYRRGVLPQKPLALVITADPGQSQTHWMCGAIMENDEIFCLDWGTVLDIMDLLKLPYQLSYHIGGTEEKIMPTVGLVDSGDWTHKVYDMCLQSRRGWFPTKGSGARIGTWSTQPVKTHPGVDLYSYNDYALKTEFYLNRIQLQRPPLFYLPRDVGSDVIAGMSGQQRLRTSSGHEWKKLPSDHFGDCAKLLVLSSDILRTARSQPQRA